MKHSQVTSIFILALITMVAQASASETVGAIDGTYNQAKVCHDDSCSTFGTINFKPSGTQAAVSITDTAITGYAWGNEMGWINMAPTGAGVTVDPSTGALYGTAWSQASGWINFRPTNSGTLSGGIPIGVSINSSGEFYGWAWNGGPYGGWIKFDCASASTCVKTDWRKTSDRSGGGGGGSSSTSNTRTYGASYFAPYTPPVDYPNPSSSYSSGGYATSTSVAKTRLALLTKILKLGTKHGDVTSLQTILQTDVTVYPSGLITGYFGPATLKAVQAFQVKYKIAKKGEAGYGQVGPKTRAVLNELIKKYNES